MSCSFVSNVYDNCKKVSYLKKKKKKSYNLETIFKKKVNSEIYQKLLIDNFSNLAALNSMECIIFSL